MFVIVLLLLIASAKASQGAKTEAPNAPTSQPASLAALVADAVAREVNVRDRAVAFDRLCQSLAGKRPRLQMHPPLSHQALQPSSPMLLHPRLMFVIVLSLLIASAKASQGKGRGSKCTNLSANRPYSPRRRCCCPRS